MGYSYVYPPLGGKGKGKSRPKHGGHSFEHRPHPHHDFDNDLFRHEEESFDEFHIEHMEPHFTPSPHDDGHGFHVGTSLIPSGNRTYFPSDALS